MTTIRWTRFKKIKIDPDAKENWALEFADYLTGNDAIGENDHTIDEDNTTVSTDGAGTIELINFPNGTAVQFWVSGITETQDVTVHLVTNEGLENDFSVKFVPKEQ